MTRPDKVAEVRMQLGDILHKYMICKFKSLKAILIKNL